MSWISNLFHRNHTPKPAPKEAFPPQVAGRPADAAALYAAADQKIHEAGGWTKTTWERKAVPGIEQAVINAAAADGKLSPAERDAMKDIGHGAIGGVYDHYVGWTEGVDLERYTTVQDDAIRGWMVSHLNSGTKIELADVKALVADVTKHGKPSDVQLSSLSAVAAWGAIRGGMNEAASTFLGVFAGQTPYLTTKDGGPDPFQAQMKDALAARAALGLSTVVNTDGGKTPYKPTGGLKDSGSAHDALSTTPARSPAIDYK